MVPQPKENFLIAPLKPLEQFKKKNSSVKNSQSANTRKDSFPLSSCESEGTSKEITEGEKEFIYAPTHAQTDSKVSKQKRWGREEDRKACEYLRVLLKSHDTTFEAYIKQVAPDYLILRSIFHLLIKSLKRFELSTTGCSPLASF